MHRQVDCKIDFYIISFSGFIVPGLSSIFQVFFPENVRQPWLAAMLYLIALARLCTIFENVCLPVHPILTFLGKQRVF
jgi:hypothetical protein